MCWWLHPIRYIRSRIAYRKLYYLMEQRRQAQDSWRRYMEDRYDD